VLKKVASEMASGPDPARPEPKAALLHLLRRVLATEPQASVTAGRTESGRSPYAVVFHACPQCRPSAVETETGRVEIQYEAIERLGSQAETTVVPPEASPVATDKPTVLRTTSSPGPTGRGRS